MMSGMGLLTSQVSELWGGPLLRPGAGLIGRFYRGFGATLSRDVPWNALSYTFFMALRSLFLPVVQREGGSDAPGWLDPITGALGG